MAILNADGVTGAHRPRLAAASLTVCKHGRIEAHKAAEDKILDAFFENLLLFRVLTKGRVK